MFVNRFVQNSILVFALLTLTVRLAAQEIPGSRSFSDLTVAAGDTEGTLALAFNYDKSFGKQNKLVIGFGGRFTSYLGKNQYYQTAPAKLTSGKTGLGVIFTENIEANIDTFLVKTATVSSLNLLITLGYNFSPKLMARFNIDAIGVSFGNKTTGNYIDGNRGSVSEASPTVFNALLTSDNDRGSLNSELFIRYLFSGHWGIKGGASFHFTEYTTKTAIQQFPEANDRFRNKSLMIALGISYSL